MNNQRHSVWFVLLSILVLVLFFADILIGSVSISLNEIIQVFTGQLPTDTP